MRGLRSLIVLLVIAIPLGWYRVPRLAEGTGRRQPEARQGLHRRGGQDRRARRSSPRPASARRSGRRAPPGKSCSPRPPPPDEAAVSGITSNLASVEIQRVIDENPTDLKEFGLAEPRIEVAFKSGGQERRLQIGQKTPSGTDLYAKARRPEEGLPHLLVPRLDLQSRHVRPARQVGAEARSRESRFARGDGRRAHDPLPEAERRMADDPAGRWPRRTPARSTGSSRGSAASR